MGHGSADSEATCLYCFKRQVYGRRFAGAAMRQAIMRGHGWWFMRGPDGEIGDFCSEECLQAYMNKRIFERNTGQEWEKLGPLR